MTAYVEQLRRSQKRVNPIDGGLQNLRLLLANDQANRRGLLGFGALVSRCYAIVLFQFYFLSVTNFLPRIVIAAARSYRLRFGKEARGFDDLMRRCRCKGRAPARSAAGRPMVNIRCSASDRIRVPAQHVHRRFPARRRPWASPGVACP